MTRESLERFYREDYRDLYSSDLNKDLFFLSQVRKGIRYYGILEKHGRIRSSEATTVFDVGCGMGGVLEAFRLGGVERVFGVDFGEEYLEEGRRRGLTLRKGSVEELQEFGFADIIVLSHVLEHVPEPVSLLKEAARRLKPDGVLFIAVPGVLNLKAYEYDLLRYLQNAHLFHFCKETLEALVNTAGLEAVYSDQTVHVIAKRANPPIPSDWNARTYTTVLSYLKKCENIVTHPQALYPLSEDGVISKIRILNRILDRKNLRMIHFDEKQRDSLSKGLAEFIL